MFTVGSYAKIWKVEPPFQSGCYRVQLSTSSKNKDGKLEKDFSDYALICSSAKDLPIAEGCTIKINKFGVTNSYSKEKGKTYYNFMITDAELVENTNSTNENLAKDTSKSETGVNENLENNGFLEDIGDELPFG